MSFTLDSITPRVRARLNDIGDSLYHDSILLPFAIDACDELQLEMELNGHLALETKSTSVGVNAGITDWNAAGLIPADMLEPQRLQERLFGSQDRYVDMVPRMWEPDVQPTDQLRYWAYREQNILTPAATTKRDVLIFYLKREFNITAITDTVTINNSQQFLINRIAALACRFIGSNPTRADQLDNIASMVLHKNTQIGAKSKQRTRTRRRPYVLTGRRRWV